MERCGYRGHLHYQLLRPGLRFDEAPDKAEQEGSGLKCAPENSDRRLVQEIMAARRVICWVDAFWAEYHCGYGTLMVIELVHRHSRLCTLMVSSLTALGAVW